MRLREAFVSKMAAAAFVMSAAQAAPALAQDNPKHRNNDAPVPVKTTGDSMVARSISINPLVPVGVIAGLGGAYALVLLMAGDRRRRMDAIHAGLGSLLVVALLNPEFVQEERAILPTEVAVVVDKTASQTLGDRAKVTEEAKDEVVKKLSDMPGVNIRIVEVDGKDGDGTNLLTAIRSAVSDISSDRLGAVIALTDGQVHDSGDSGFFLAGGAPLHALISGNENERDRKIVIESTPSYGLIGKAQNISFKVIEDGTGKGAGERVPVTVSSEGRILAHIMTVPGEVTQVRVSIPHTGPNLFELKAGKLDGELTEINNRMVVSVEGIRQNLSVLLVSGDPNPNIRMWRDLLKADPGTDLVHFTIRRTPDKIDSTPSKELALIPVPTHELFTERLGKFDLVIFDRYEYNGLIPAPYFNNVARYVKDGGAIMVVSGPEYTRSGSLYNTPLKSVLPAVPGKTVAEAPYIPRVSETGARHPVTRSLMEESDPKSWGRWLRIMESQGVSSGHVVMEGSERKPLMVLKREEKGRVAMLQSDNAWLWARGFDGGGPYANLFMQTVQWLLKNPTLEEEALRLRSEGGKLIIEQQTMGKESTPVTVETPSGKAINVLPQPTGPGLWRIAIPAEEQGIYSASWKGQNVPQTYASIGPEKPKEFTSALSTAGTLKPVVERTGGMIARMTDSSGKLSMPDIVARTGKESLAGTDWMGIRRTEASIQKGINHTPLMPWWAAATLAIGLAGGFYWWESGRSLKKSAAPRNDGPGMP